MSADNRHTEALTHALEAQAKSTLALIDELTQSRVIQQRMANTLVEIHTGQAQLVEQLASLIEQQKDQLRTTGEHGKRLAVVENKTARNEERIERLEKTRPGAFSAAR